MLPAGWELGGDSDCGAHRKVPALSPSPLDTHGKGQGQGNIKALLVLLPFSTPGALSSLPGPEPARSIPVCTLVM
jgi:hypothetical protein